MLGASVTWLFPSEKFLPNFFLRFRRKLAGISMTPMVLKFNLTKLNSFWLVNIWCFSKDKGSVLSLQLDRIRRWVMALNGSNFRTLSPVLIQIANRKLFLSPKKTYFNPYRKFTKCLFLQNLSLKGVKLHFKMSGIWPKMRTFPLHSVGWLLANGCPAVLLPS